MRAEHLSSRVQRYNLCIWTITPKFMLNRSRSIEERPALLTGAVLREYKWPVASETGRIFAAWACGGPARDGTRRWQGWLEFRSAGRDNTLRTPRETTQPSRAATVYWAAGVTRVYLEGALRRARPQTAIGSGAGHLVGPRLDLMEFDRRFLQWLGISENQG
jgi:hypothetical protein